MAENDARPTTDIKPSALQEPQFANPLRRLALSGFLLVTIGIAVVWGGISLIQDAVRARKNYNQVLRPSFEVAPPARIVMPEVGAPAIPQGALAQPEAPLRARR